MGVNDQNHMQDPPSVARRRHDRYEQLANELQIAEAGHSPYIEFDYDDDPIVVLLDGSFSLAELKLIIQVCEEIK